MHAYSVAMTDSSETVHATAMLSRNLLQLPLLRELPTQRIEICDAVLARPQNRILRGDAAVGRNSQVERREQWVRHAICAELDELVLVQALRYEVAEGVVLFGKLEDGGVGYACG
jgi:hypothetical protein